MDIIEKVTPILQGKNCPTFKTETKSALDSVLLKEPCKAPNQSETIF